MAGAPVTRQIIGSDAEKLFRLFDSFGKKDGMRRLAAAIGVSVQVPLRWASARTGDPKSRGNDGMIPPEFNERIIEGARQLLINPQNVRPLLQLRVCPTCRRPMPVGRRL